MGEKSKIQWTGATWNIARGCTKVDEDCKFCYMYREGERYKYDAKEVIRTKTVFNMPLKLKEPSVIFTCSLTDFFHEAIDSYRAEAWAIIKACPQHIFQILTKRPERISECLPEDWNAQDYRHIWFGTSVGSNAGRNRIQDLIDQKIFGKLFIYNKLFLSLEPLHGPVEFHSEKPIFMEDPLLYIDWIIVGGESGNETGKYRYRPCFIPWIEYIIKAARLNKIPVFVKQLGTYLAKQLDLKDRHGGDIDEFPSHLQIREFPADIEVINGIPVPKNILKIIKK